MQLLTLFEVCIVLSQSLECELVGKTDEGWIRDMRVQKLLDLHRVRRTVHHDLAIRFHDLKNILDVDLEVHGKELVHFIEHE